MRNDFLRLKSKDWIRNIPSFCASRLSGKGSSDAGKSSGKSGSFFGGGGYALRHRKRLIS